MFRKLTANEEIQKLKNQLKASSERSCLFLEAIDQIDGIIQETYRKKGEPDRIRILEAKVKELEQELEAAKREM